MSMRQMVDCTHQNLPAVLPTIRQLIKGDVVAGYGTGGPTVEWTPADWATIPYYLDAVIIDQAFGPQSPLPKANVVDVETNAWLPGQVDARMALSTAPRPTVYAALDTLNTIAQTEKWRGDVWLAEAAVSGPLSPPLVSAGFTVVAWQWNFSSPTHDGSVVFDATWPAKGMSVTTPAAPTIQENWKYCIKCTGMFYGPFQIKSVCPAGGTHDGSDSGSYLLTVIPQ